MVSLKVCHRLRQVFCSCIFPFANNSVIVSLGGLFHDLWKHELPRLLHKHLSLSPQPVKNGKKKKVLPPKLLTRWTTHLIEGGFGFRSPLLPGEGVAPSVSTEGVGLKGEPAWLTPFPGLSSFGRTPAHDRISRASLPFI